MVPRSCVNNSRQHQQWIHGQAPEVPSIISDNALSKRIHAKRVVLFLIFKSATVHSSVLRLTRKCCLAYSVSMNNFQNKEGGRILLARSFKDYGGFLKSAQVGDEFANPYGSQGEDVSYVVRRADETSFTCEVYEYGVSTGRTRLFNRNYG